MFTRHGKHGSGQTKIKPVADDAALVKRLKTLDLSRNGLGDTEAKILLGANAIKQLAKLERIDLTQNQMSAAITKQVGKALPNAVVTSQDKSRRGPEFFFRYIGAME